MPLSDNISVGMENFTTVALRILNFTDQEFSKAVEFQQENSITGTYWFEKLGWVLIFN